MNRQSKSGEQLCPEFSCDEREDLGGCRAHHFFDSINNEQDYSVVFNYSFLFDRKDFDKVLKCSDRVVLIASNNVNIIYE